MSAILPILILSAEESIPPGFLAIIGMSIVFSGLIVLLLIINLLKFVIFKVQQIIQNRKESKQQWKSDQSKKISNEVTVAIAMALNQHMKKYLDEQEYIITLKKYTKSMTPWALDGRGRINKSFKRSWR